jgi:hypothetical protein
MIDAEYLFQWCYKLLLWPCREADLQLFGLYRGLTALIPTGVSADSEGKASLYWRKLFLDFPAAAAGRCLSIHEKILYQQPPAQLSSNKGGTETVSSRA